MNESGTESIKNARSACFALLAVSAALLAFSLSVDLPDYEGAIAEISALASIEESGRSEYSNRMIGTLVAKYGETATKASGIVLDVLRQLGVDASNRSPSSSIDPTGALWHNIEEETTLSEWSSFLSNTDSDIGVFVPDLQVLKSEFQRSFLSAFQRQYNYELASIRVDRVTFSHNTNTGYVSGRDTIEALQKQDSVSGIVLMRIEPKKEGIKAARLSPWLHVPVPGHIEILPRFSFKGYILHHFERLGHKKLVQSLLGRGEPFPKMRQFWPEIADLSPEAALKHLTSLAKSTESQSQIEVWGLSIPSRIVTVTAPLLVVLSMLYVFSHIGHLRRHKHAFSKEISSYGWIVLFPDPLSRSISALSIVALPAVALIVLLYQTWQTLSSPLVAYSVAAIVVVSCIGVIAVRAIQTLAK
jgi:hypothetical protein